MTLVYKDDSNTPIDISGSTPSIVLTDNVFDATADSFTGTLTTDGSDGSFSITLTTAQVDGLGFANGRYIIQLVGSVTDTLLYGKFQVKPLKY